MEFPLQRRSLSARPDHPPGPPPARQDTLSDEIGTGAVLGAKDASIGYKTINVRSETVATTPSAENRSNRSDASFPQIVSMSGGGTARACNRIVSR
jgi:hypothetical protein